MNFDEAIQAHSAWKLKLSVYLKKPDGSIKVADLQTDRNCPLGKWIYGEGAKWSSLPEFAVLKSEHANFHIAAARVVTKADQGQQVNADIAIGGASEFSKSSSKVVRAIMDIRRRVG